ncbi:hypothetical protein [Wolbachia endosymbiont of Nasonia vitripennis]
MPVRSSLNYYILSNASVHSHSEVSTCLSEIGVTKLGGNINR